MKNIFGNYFEFGPAVKGSSVKIYFSSRALAVPLFGPVEPFVQFR